MYHFDPKSLGLPKGADKSWNDFIKQVRDQFTNISRATSTQGGTTIVISGSGGSSSSSTTTTTATNIKSGVHSVTAGVAAYIAFPVVFSSTPYVTLCFIAGTDSSFGVINTQNLTITTSGFSIPSADVLVSGTIFYIATTN